MMAMRDPPSRSFKMKELKDVFNGWTAADWFLFAASVIFFFIVFAAVLVLVLIIGG